MGGVDAEKYTLQILKEITKSKYAKNCAFTVVTGGSYPHTNTLNEFVETEITKDIQATNTIASPLVANFCFIIFCLASTIAAS